VKPVFDELMDQKLIENGIFAFYLTSEKSGIPSELTFGYIDESKYTGDIHWADVKMQYMFGVQLDDVVFNGKSSGICKGKGCLITFDSGTSLMSFPPAAVKGLALAGVPFEKHVKRCKSAKDFGNLDLMI